jgi:hypothetical protein
MPSSDREVVVVDIKIPFFSMVILMVKWAIAAIPAVIILVAIAGATAALMAMIFGAGWHTWSWGGGGPGTGM